MSNNASKITTDLDVDPPLVQHSDFEFDADDRQLLDNQVRGIEQHLVDTLINGKHATWFDLSSESVAVAPGDTVCLASSSVSTRRGVMTKCTALALGHALASGGVVLRAAAAGTRVLVANGGVLPPTLTQLAAAVPGFVRVNTTTGRCERVASLAADDYGIGTVDNAGWMQVALAMSTSAAGATSSLNLTATDWYINSSSGNDANVGTDAGHPLLTIGELRNRWGIDNEIKPSTGTTITVHLIGNFGSDDILELTSVQVASGTILVFQGVATSTRTGSFTAVTTFNRATNVPWKGTDAAMGGAAWTTDIGKRVRITSGARAGNFAWVADDLGSHQAVFSQWAQVQDNDQFVRVLSLGTAQSGDPYAVESLSEIYISEVRCDANFVDPLVQPPFIIFKDLNLKGLFTLIGPLVSAHFVGCQIEAILSATGTLFEVSLENSCIIGEFNGTELRGPLVVQAGLNQGQFRCDPGGSIQLDGDAMTYGGNIVVVAGSVVNIGTACVFNSPGDGVVVGDDFNSNPGLKSARVHLSIADYFFGTHALWGSGNVGVGVAVGPLAGMCYEVNIPTITGSGGDFSLGEVLTGRAWDEDFGAYKYSCPTTWANLAAAISSTNGFGGFAHNLETDSSVVTTGVSSGGGPRSLTKGTSYSLARGDRHVTFTAGGQTGTLPASPIDGQRHAIKSGGAFTSSVDGGGHNIDGSSSYTQAVNGECTELRYSSAAGQWEIV